MLACVPADKPTHTTRRDGNKAKQSALVGHFQLHASSNKAVQLIQRVCGSCGSCGFLVTTPSGPLSTPIRSIALAAFGNVGHARAMLPLRSDFGVGESGCRVMKGRNGCRVQPHTTHFRCRRVPAVFAYLVPTRVCCLGVSVARYPPHAVCTFGNVKSDACLYIIIAPD